MCSSDLKKETAIAKDNNLALGRELGIIIPNTGKQFRSAKIIADHGDGTFTLSGVQGNKQAQLSNLPASSIVRAIDRYNQESGIKSEGDKWRANYLLAAKLARSMGIDPKQHGKLPGLVKAIDAATAEQDAGPSLDQKTKEEESATKKSTPTINERRISAELAKQSKWKELRGADSTIKASIERAVKEGWLFEQVEVTDSAAIKRDQEKVKQASKRYMLGMSNPNIPEVKAALEAKARLDAGTHKKPEYRLSGAPLGDGSHYVITKIAYDYAKTFEAQQKTEAPNLELSQQTEESRAEAERAEKARIEEIGRASCRERV